MIIGKALYFQKLIKIKTDQDCYYWDFILADNLVKTILSLLKVKKKMNQNKGCQSVYPERELLKRIVRGMKKKENNN
ncbi:MAG: hypothetical protein GY795_01480 [Desulfobacterales bacterium]|nr:hypothetical protein [Desulfobacterales bacterium]